MEIYEDKTSLGQVYTTYKYGTICGRITSEGEFSVVPHSFKNLKSYDRSKSILVSCVAAYDNDPNSYKIENGASVRIGCTLTFTVIGIGGALKGKPKYIWQVCNSGTEEYIDPHEIYYKGSNEPTAENVFKRELVYTGTHFLKIEV